MHDRTNPPLRQGLTVSPINVVLAILAGSMIALALWKLLDARSGLLIERALIGETQAMIYRPATGSDPARPVVVIAHGFAGSQQLMQPFAITFARNGYTAITFDFLGHGRSDRPLGGSITELNGATRALIEQTAVVAAHARGLGNSQIVMLGHSMATDIIIRLAIASPEIVATIAVSAFSQAVTATAPRNLLMIAGGWETYLAEAGRRLVALVSAPVAARDDTTYGDFANGTARRLAIAQGVEHISVLYSQTSMVEAQSWLDQTTGREQTTPRFHDRSGPWIMLLLAGLVLMVRPLSSLLPVVSHVQAGAGLGWRRLWPLVVGPALLTPIILRFIPTHFLPILVADYLAAHFAIMGLLTWLGLWLFKVRKASPATLGTSAVRIAVATVLAFLISFAGLAMVIDAFVTSFVPIPARLPLILALLVGTLSYCLANEWLTRGIGAGRAAYAASQVAFLLSLVLAISLDFKRLFFLAIIVPVIVPFLLVFGLFSRWIYARTGHPLVAAIANAIAFAVAIGVTFPMLAG